MREIPVLLRVERGKRRTSHAASYPHFESLDEALAALGPEQALILINRATRHEAMRVARINLTAAGKC